MSSMYTSIIYSEPQNEACLLYREAVKLTTSGSSDQVILALERATYLEPTFKEAHYLLALLLLKVGNKNKALIYLNIVSMLDPLYSNTQFVIGEILFAEGKFEEAIQHFRSARIHNLKMTNKQHVKISHALFSVGEFQEGWLVYESRNLDPNIHPLKRPFNNRHFEQPLWDGNTLNQPRVLIHTDQGLGDTIQFIRFASLIKAKGVTVLFECQKALVSLLKLYDGIDKVFSQGEEPPTADYHIPLMELLRVLKITIDTIPQKVSYLTASNDCNNTHIKEILKQSSKTNLKIGFVWATGCSNNNFSRYCSLSEFNILFCIPNTTFYSIYKGECISELEPYQNVINLGVLFEDFIDTAYVISKLDLIITVDTSVAHLSGALGKPTWLLLPFISDWRWFVNRQDSPWYPTMRLFRQRETSNWASVIQEVYFELSKGHLD